MKSSRRTWSIMLGIGAVLALTGGALADSPLSIGGSSANFGVHRLAGGFTPDPKVINVTSGGSLDASTMGLGGGCRGFVTAQPDAILHFSGQPATGRLRFFVQSRRAADDTTLLINDPAGGWHCNDDLNGSSNKNPQVDLQNPATGQYDIWVGSYTAGQNLRVRLNITELDRSPTPG